MATKEEILKGLEKNKANIQTFSMFYTFDEGEKIELPRPQEGIDFDSALSEILASGRIEENNVYLMSLLYYKTLKDSAPISRISGFVSLDKNLFNEDNPMNSKTPASAVFNRKEEIICLRDNIFTGGYKEFVNDIICTLHEARHYHQCLQEVPYKRTLDDKVEGGLSEKDRLSFAFRLFEMEDLFPKMSREDYDKICYAMYHQDEKEVDARSYSFAEAINIIENALKKTDLSRERRRWLEVCLNETKKQSASNLKENKKQASIYKLAETRVKEYAMEIQQQVETKLSPENIAKLEHYDERDPETEEIRQFIFKLEASLFVNYDENLAKLIEKICETYQIYAVGRKLIQHPQFVPSEKFLDKVILEDFSIIFGEPSMCPPYDKSEVLDRYATLKAGKVKTDFE